MRTSEKRKRIKALNCMDNFVSHIRQKLVHLRIVVHGKNRDVATLLSSFGATL